MPDFNIPMSNIPMINLRTEFEEHLRLIKSAEFRDTVFDSFNTPISIPNLTWHGMPNDLLTLMLQRSIAGLEAYLCAAVEYELSVRGLLTEELKEIVSEPFSLGRGKAVLSLYEKMPGLIDKSLKLSMTKNSKLYGTLKDFYKTVRNPLFHGNQVRCDKETYGQIIVAFELIASVYGWIDDWYSAFPWGWGSNNVPTPSE